MINVAKLSPLLTEENSQPIVEAYHQIRSKYLMQSSLGYSAPAAPLTDSHGFFQQAEAQALTERHGGFDKLFYTLIRDIVEDPDYALKKDPKVYKRMLRDPQIYYCLMVRKAATKGLPWTVVPPEEFAKDKIALKLAKQAENRIRRIPRFRELLDNILEAMLPGLSVNELVWRYDKEANEYIVDKHFPMEKDRFVFDRDGNLRLKQPMATFAGKRVPNYKFVTHTFNMSDGAWAFPEEAGYVYFGKGLADTPLYHYFYFKITALRFLLKGLERYGHPFKVFYTGAQNQALTTRLHEIMTALANDSVVSIPGKKGETNVDIAKGNPASRIFMTFVEYIDRLITRAILGQELMTEVPVTGARAAAQIHQSVFASIVETDKDLLQDTLNSSLLQYDAILNTPNIPERLRPVFRFKKGTLADAAQFLTAVQSAISLGITISEAQVRELTGFRKPVDEDDFLMQPVQQLQGTNQKSLAVDDAIGPKSETTTARTQ